MYSQTFLVTSVRASVDLPQIAASSVLSFSGVIFFNAAFVIVVFFVVVVATVVFVVVVIVM